VVIHKRRECGFARASGSERYITGGSNRALKRVWYGKGGAAVRTFAEQAKATKNGP